MSRFRAFVSKHKTLFTSLGFLVLFGVTVSQAAPLVSPYNPGQTLDPQCAPGDTNCTVTVAGSTSFTALTNTPTTLAGYGITDAYTMTAADARYVIAAGVAGGQTVVGGTGINDGLSFTATSGNGTLTNNAIQFKVGNNGATTAMYITNTGNVGIGISSPTTILALGGSRSATAWGTNGIQLQIKGATYTDLSSSGTVSNAAMNSIANSTITSSNLAVYTNASTLYIAGAPTAGTNTSITNPWALNVAGGNVNFGGSKAYFGSVAERVVVESNGNGSFLSFNHDPDLGTIFDTNGYGYQFSHSKSIVASADRLSLNVFNPSGTSINAPFTATGQGFVGINDIAPTQALTVNGNIQINGTGNGLFFPDGSFISTATGGTGVGTSSTTDVNFDADSDNNGTGVINFSVGGIQGMTVANNSYVGIGTTSPTQPLTVNGNIQVSGTGNGIYFPDGSFMGSAANIGTGISAPGNVALLADSDNTDSTAGISLAIAGTTYLDMVNNGNIGIGLTPGAPSTTLQISSTSGNGVMIGSGTYPSYMGTNGLYVAGELHAATNIINSGAGINWGASQARIVGVNPTTDSNSYLSFYTGSVAAQGERMRIIDNGNIGIGTITPDALLSIGSTLVPTATVVADFQNAGGTCDLDPSTTGGLSCSSDMNLKKNITNLSDGSAWSFDTNITPASQSILDKVLALNPVDYNWNVESDSDPKHAGFIAQEVQQVFPDLVSTNTTTGTLSLDYTGLIPYTVAALQQMNLNITDIDDLTTTNTWRQALINWLGDSANGIASIFSSQVTTPTLCVGTADDKTCITKSQLDQLLQQNGETGTSGTTVSEGATSSDSSDTSDTVSSQSPDTSDPTVSVPATDDSSIQSPQSGN